MSGKPLILGPGEGRTYEMPDMRAVFKADGGETGDGYSISEWWVKPHGMGPGSHSHEANDEIFYGIGGMMSVLVGETWHDVSAGAFLRIPAGTAHDFENRTDEPAGLFNVFIPGGFEKNMPAIVQWYVENG
jgi:mannose-6-phosphate isomerase-like protein (cupin superfamily)